MTNPQEQDNSTTAAEESVSAADVAVTEPETAPQEALETSLAVTDAPASEEAAVVVEPDDETIKAEIRDLIAQIVVKIQAIKDQPSILKTLETALANSLKHF